MEVKARLVSVSEDYQNREALITFASSDSAKIRQFADAIDKDMPLRLKACVWHEKRSLDANAYFHVLVGKIADVIGVSKSYVKNDLITSYGQMEWEDDAPVQITTNIPIDKMMEIDYLHCKAIGFENGNTIYQVYRGSHTYDTKEMSILIDGSVHQAKELGIETMTSDELERIKAAWQA